jgi:hypothetical protein
MVALLAHTTLHVLLEAKVKQTESRSSMVVEPLEASQHESLGAIRGGEFKSKAV